MTINLIQWLPFALISLLLVIQIPRLISANYHFSQNLTVFCLLIYLIVIAGLCLTPTAYNFDQEQILHYSVWGPVKYILIPFQHVDLEWWLNIVMTIPFGILLTLFNSRIAWKHILIIGFVAGITIEGSQFILDWLINIHRWVETDDVLTNWAGVLIGYSLVWLLKQTAVKKFVNKFQVH